jgi:hypothetical protein
VPGVLTIPFRHSCHLIIRSYYDQRSTLCRARSLGRPHRARRGARLRRNFKIVTVKDDITVGLNDAELKEFGDAGGIAETIAAKGSLTLWQYAVIKKDGDSVVAPRAKIGVLANSSLRVEPYKQPFQVLPHE